MYERMGLGSGKFSPSNCVAMSSQSFIKVVRGVEPSASNRLLLGLEGGVADMTDAMERGRALMAVPSVQHGRHGRGQGWLHFTSAHALSKAVGHYSGWQALTGP